MLKQVVALTLVASLVLPGCTKQARVQVDPRLTRVNLVELKIVGITTTAGEIVTFDRRGETVLLTKAGEIVTLDRRGRTVLTTTAGKTVTYDRRGETVLTRDDVSAVEGYVNGERRHYSTTDVNAVWIETSKATAGGLIVAVLAVSAVALLVGAWTGWSQPAPPPTGPEGGSCPFVYSWDGARYLLDAEPFGGAIARGLQRDDWSELPHLRAAGGEYRLLMANEADETQHTDLAELLVADHAPGVRVVADGQGVLRGFRRVEPLAQARDGRGRDLKVWLSAEDRRVWEPEPLPASQASVREEIVLEFARPKGARHAWLVANASTGLWGSIVVKDMVGLLGREAGPWIDSLGRDPFSTVAVYKWAEREETFQLNVDVETKDGWTRAGYLLGSGPAVTATRTVGLDIPDDGAAVTRVRIRPPAGFWALNAFGISYEDAEAVVPRRIPALEARTDQGAAVAGALSAADGDYYTMPHVGERAELRFPAPPPAAGLARTLFLHTSGWYQLHLPATGEPNRRAFDALLTQPGGAARFSSERWENLKRSLAP